MSAHHSASKGGQLQTTLQAAAQLSAGSGWNAQQIFAICATHINESQTRCLDPQCQRTMLTQKQAAVHMPDRPFLPTSWPAAAAAATATAPIIQQ
jgi:hypothetical protein